MRAVHKTCSSICGTPVGAILDQKTLTRLAGGGQGRSKYGQECASSNDRNGLDLASEPFRGPYLGQGPRKWTQINQGQFEGMILVPFHLSTESLKPLKWPQRPDIAKTKPGFVESGFGCFWRVHEPLQYFSFDNIQTLGQLGSEINAIYVRRPGICVFCLLCDND